VENCGGVGATVQRWTGREAEAGAHHIVARTAAMKKAAAPTAAARPNKRAVANHLLRLFTVPPIPYWPCRLARGLLHQIATARAHLRLRAQLAAVVEEICDSSTPRSGWIRPSTMYCHGAPLALGRYLWGRSVLSWGDHEHSAVRTSHRQCRELRLAQQMRCDKLHIVHQSCSLAAQTCMVVPCIFQHTTRRKFCPQATSLGLAVPAAEIFVKNTPSISLLLLVQRVFAHEHPIHPFRNPTLRIPS
jgi:hypothetical protein